ncbi:glycosyltransferase family 4 protein [Candidatus Bathyarchaeota archaeon]|nr:glycosyltransferase family 4 protein [Candidatus Bathyarchaeota archaeon]
MKILFMTSRDITHPEWAGGDVYHFEVSRRLAHDGNCVTMLCSRYDGCRDQEKIDGIQIIRIRGGILRALSNFLFYRKYLKRGQDIIVEEAEGPAGPLFAFLYAKEPVVIMWHQLGRTIYFNQFSYPIAVSLLVMEKIYVALARKCQIIVPSNERAFEFINIGFPKEKVNVVSPAFALRKDANHGGEKTFDKPYFLILGKLRRYKAYHHAVRALKLLRDEHENCILVIAGRRGEEKYCKELEKLIAKCNLQDSVIIKPNVNENEKATLLSNARALIVTSPIEGFSIVSVEANSLGVPVIATNGVPNEVIANGFNGIKYRFGDIENLANAMSKMLHDDALREKLSANSIESSHRFSWNSSAKTFKEVLQKVLKQTPHKQW